MTAQEREILDARFGAIVRRLNNAQRRQMGAELQETVKEMERLGAAGDDRGGIEVAKAFASKWELLSKSELEGSAQ